MAEELSEFVPRKEYSETLKGLAAGIALLDAFIFSFLEAKGLATKEEIKAAVLAAAKASEDRIEPEYWPLAALRGLMEEDAEIIPFPS